MPSDLNKNIYPRSWEMEVRKDPSLFMVHIMYQLFGWIFFSGRVLLFWYSIILEG